MNAHDPRTTTRPPPAGIGPRRVGGTYRSGRTGVTYRVDHLTIDGGWWSVTVTDLDGRRAGKRSTHRIPWDHTQDQVLTPGVLTLTVAGGVL